ncbi:hypothetical protein [Maribacter aestuarii]|uniref:hypothetical protein n=1 Tax=Maribacter aestuarii TaxID=1130723 RepID=UPI0025A5834B|nr:hypothetical protein [Maribacter aestuarii]
MHAQNPNAAQTYQKGDKLFTLGLEYVDSFSADKDIDLYSFRLGYGSLLFKNVVFFGTLNISGTSGLLKIENEDTTEILNAESFGFGTSFLFRWYFVQFKNISLFLDVGAGLLYSFQSFPPKGTKLNFTTRPGGGLAININSRTQLLGGINRFHLSNGQGYNHPFNPAFDGLGFFVGIILRMK